MVYVKMGNSPYQEPSSETQGHYRVLENGTLLTSVFSKERRTVVFLKTE